jgi:transposase InsO family protein
MDVHKNARSLPASRALLVDRIEKQGWSLSAAARAAGMSVRRSGVWHRRGKAHEPFEDRRSTPNRQPTRISAEERVRIVALRRERMTMRQIAVSVHRSVATVARVCSAVGLSRLSMLDGPPAPVQRYEYAAPGDMVHLDTKRLGCIEGGPGHRVTGDRRGRKHAGWEWMHVAVDDHSRTAYAEILPSDDGPTAAVFLRRAQRWFAEYKVTIARSLTDNGGSYKSRVFAAAADELCIRRKRTRPYTPRTNGKAERFIQTLLRECIYRFSYVSSQQRQEHLSRYLHFYNYHRAHTSLNMNPPISRLVGNNVLRRNN